MRIANKPAGLGLVLPEPLRPPPGVVLPFPWVRVHGDRAFASGHGPQLPDGSLAGPFDKIDADLTPKQGYEAARLTALGILSSLKRALGDLDRVTAWLRVFGIPVEIEAEVAIGG